MNTVPFSLRRVGLIAGVTLREALRQKLLHALVLIAAGLVLGVRGLRDFNFGVSELKFIADFGDGAIAGFGAALTIALTAQLFFSEIEHRTALTLLAKPVWRTEFLLGKFLGVAVVAVAFCGLLTATLVGVLGQRQLALQVDQPEAWATAHAVNFGALWVAAYLHTLKLALLAAGTLLVASFAQTQIFAVMAGGAGFVICHLQGLAQAAYERNAASLMSVPATLIHWMFPDFQRFVLPADGAWTWSGLAQVSVYAGVYAAVALALAVRSFREREV
jgi:ABC-type Na+ efflux pump permease subunit